MQLVRGRLQLHQPLPEVVRVGRASLRHVLDQRVQVIGRLTGKFHGRLKVIDAIQGGFAVAQQLGLAGLMRTQQRIELPELPTQAGDQTPGHDQGQQQQHPTSGQA